MEQIVAQYIKRELKKYPKMENIDVFKHIFQVSFLTGHNIVNARENLDNEIANIDNLSSNTSLLYEYISNDVVRVNIIPFIKKFDKELLLDSFIKSNNYNCNIDELVKEVKDNYLCEIRIINLLTNINVYNGLTKGIICPSHSNIYKDYYNPHYRIIKSEYLDIMWRVSKLNDFIANIKNDRKTIIACEGKCASGKTTITNKLSNVTIIHTDDFFNPKGLERLNFTYLNEILEEVKTKDEIVINAYDCDKKEYIKKIVEVKNIIIVEGVYSYDTFLRKHYDYLIYFECCNQLERLKNRCTKEIYQKFINTWIPKENEYFNSFNFIEESDLLI